MNTRRDEIRLILTRKLQQMIGEIVEEMLVALDEEKREFTSLDKIEGIFKDNPAPRVNR